MVDLDYLRPGRHLGRAKRAFVAAAIIALFQSDPALAEPFLVKVGMLRQTHSTETLSVLDIPASDDALAGALLGAADNNTTGKFTGQSFEVIDSKIEEADDPSAAAQKLVDQGASLIIADLPADRLLQAADALKQRGALIFNAGATDENLREENCRANIFHTAPSRSMLTDGLAQYLV